MCSLEEFLQCLKRLKVAHSKSFQDLDFFLARANPVLNSCNVDGFWGFHLLMHWVQNLGLLGLME